VTDTPGGSCSDLLGGIATISNAHFIRSTFANFRNDWDVRVNEVTGTARVVRHAQVLSVFILYPESKYESDLRPFVEVVWQATVLNL
jgi:hypothetical protein